MSGRSTLKKEMNKDEVTNHMPLFGYYLHSTLEEYILEKVDLRTLITSRMVNSQWKAAVDNLNALWSRLTRRLGVAEAPDKGTELYRAQKMLGECWITSSFCPTVHETDTLDEDLQLSHVRLDSNSGSNELVITAFNTTSLASHTWALNLMPTSLFVSTDVKLEATNIKSHRATNWLAMLSFQENPMNLRKKDATSEGAYKKIQKRLHEDFDGSDSDKSDESGEIDDDATSSVRQESYDIRSYNASENKTLVNFASTQGRSSKDVLHRKVRKLSYTSIKRLFAIVSLKRTPTNSAVPLALIEQLDYFDNVINIATLSYNDSSCSDTKVLVLTHLHLLLYSLTSTSECPDESTAAPQVISSPDASIDFASTLLTNAKESGQHTYKYMSIDTSIDSNYVVCIRKTSAENMRYESLDLVKTDCHQLQYLSTVRISNYGIVAVSEQTLLLNRPPQMTFGVPSGSDSMRLVRFYVSAQNRLHLEYDPCVYCNPVWCPLLQYTGFFSVGKRFWYCIGGDKSSNLTLVVYLIGCPAPLLNVNLGYLFPQSSKEDNEWIDDSSSESNSCISCIASTWVNSGFEPDSQDQTPLIAMLWENEIYCLIGWCFGIPKWPMSVRCQSACVTKEYQLDYPWSQLFPKMVESKRAERRSDVSHLVTNDYSRFELYANGV